MPTPEPFGLSQISQVSVTTHDVERAEAFYRDVLGMQHLFSMPGMAFFQCGDVRLMLAVPSGEAFDHPSSILYFEVEDIDHAYRVLTERGVPFEGPPHVVAKQATHTLWMAFFRDRDDNVLALSSEVSA